MENKLGRTLPADVMEQLQLTPFQTTEIGNPEVQRTAPQVRLSTGNDKVTNDLKKNYSRKCS